MITRDEVLKGQDLPDELEDNLTDLLLKLNQFRTAFGKPMVCSSGYRSSEHNLKIGGRARSAHLIAKAADFLDPYQEIKVFCLENLNLLDKIGLWMEDPNHTPGWVHLQTRPAIRNPFIP